MKISPRDIPAVIAKPHPKYLCYFFHGADLGLIRERATHMAKQIVSDLDDPFQSVLLNGEELKADPAKLADEVSSLPVFGDERLVRIRGTGTELLGAVKAAIPFLSQGCRLIIEASDTTTKHAIVKFCESEAQIASIGCYSDEDRDIGQLATAIFAKDNIAITKAGLALLVSRLGSDRLASRSEIDKLVLLAGPEGSLSEDDIDQALGDSSARATELLLTSLLTGDVTGLSVMLEKARQEDIAPIAIMRQLATSFRQIFEASAFVSQGESASGAIAKLRPPVHFKSKPLLTAAAGRLSKNAAMAYWQRLVSLESELKSGQMADPYTHLGQALLGLCLRLKR